MASDLSKSLYTWAKNNPDNIILLEEWRDAAVLQLASGQGKEVVNTMANGVSVGFAQGQTVADWFKTVMSALQYLESPPQNKVTGVLR